VIEPVKQETGIRLSCILGPYLFNIFTDGITTACISEENQHLQAQEKQIILPLLLTDDLAIGSLNISGLLGVMDQMMTYCNNWNVKCNLNKTKVMVFKKKKKGRKTENRKCCYKNCQDCGSKGIYLL